jgi:predicted nuclease with TOPRIM domain
LIAQGLEEDNRLAEQRIKTLESENKLLQNENSKLREEVQQLEENLEQTILNEETALVNGTSNAAPVAKPSEKPAKESSGKTEVCMSANYLNLKIDCEASARS